MIPKTKILTTSALDTDTTKIKVADDIILDLTKPQFLYNSDTKR